MMQDRDRLPGGQGSFRQFYLTKVAINEACNCAELIVRRDLPRLEPKGTGRLLLRWLAARLLGRRFDPSEAR